MLLKLMKYDARYMLKNHIGPYLVVIISALAVMISNIADIEILSGFTMVLYVLSVIATGLCTMVLAVLYFRRNLLKDEGYLMNTLPVPAWMLFVSKYIIAIAMMILDAVMVIISFSITVRNTSWMSDASKMLKVSFEDIGWDINPVVFLVGSLFFTIIYTLAMLFFSLTTGYRANGSKDMYSVLSFVAVYAIGQIINMIIMFLVPLGKDGSYFSVMLKASEDSTAMFEVDMVGMIDKLMAVSISISVVFIIVFIAGSIYNMTKKLNLE